ncbi:MAG: RagB/SusD family nutrient uptake outer membrane protein [Arcicella sp.]|nr:RagB/SusD family nutrient uptake outer membrane protein [Arcicella sp.]
MKNFILKNTKSLLASVIMLSATGCSDLKENPDFINPSTFYQSAKELELGVNAVYDDLTMGNGDWYNHFYNRYVFECLVGYQVGWEKGPLQYNLGNISASDDYINAYWQQCYRSIDRANNIIETADKIKDIANADKVKRIKAEAQFLRGFYYYELVRYFDNPPLKITSTQSYSDLPSNDGGKQKVLEQIYADCSAAASILPASYSGSDAGRATKWAAKTLLMKAQLWGQKWAEAKATSEDIINNSGLSLYPDFGSNFDVSHKNQGERIFEGQVSAKTNSAEYTNNSAHFNPEDFPSDLGGAGWSWISATKDFRMSYKKSDKRIDATFIESYPTGRTAKNSKGEFPMVKWSEKSDYNLSRFGGLVDPNANPNKPEELIFSKAWAGKLVELNISSWTNTEKNTIYLRYADVLLGHSEACNESGQGDAFASINKLRDRAGLEPLKVLSQSALRDAIVDEIIHEFAFEQVGYPELRRKSKFGGNPDYLGDYIKRYSDTYKVGRTVKAKDYVLPIPLIEIQGNPKVKQNPEWQ